MRVWVAFGLAVLLSLVLPSKGEIPLGAARPRLPAAQAAFAAVWTPGGAYLLGGDRDTGQTDDIIQWMPGQDPAVIAESLPAPRWGGRAVWTGQAIYVFGGYDLANHRSVDEVLRYVPGGAAPMVVAHMPGTRDWMAVFWDERTTTACPHGCAYLVGGGRSGVGGLDTILRFEPDAASFSTMAARLTGGRWGLGIAWDGQHAYIVGGYDGLRTYDVIVSYDPATDKLATVASLPWPAVDSAVAWHDGAVYIAGGHVADMPYAYPSLVRWVPGTAAVGSCLPLPRPSQKAALVSTGDELWLLGGYDDRPGGKRFATDAMRELAWTACVDTQAAGLPQVPPVPVVAQPEHAAPAKVKVSAGLSLDWSSEVDVQVTAMVETGLATTIPGLPATDVGLPFAAVHSTIEGGRAQVRLTFDVPAAASSNATVYYYNGTAWLDVMGDADATIASAGPEGDLHVLGKGRSGNQLWVDVDHTSIFAVAPTAPQAPGGGAIAATPTPSSAALPATTPAASADDQAPAVLGGPSSTQPSSPHRAGAGLGVLLVGLACALAAAARRRRP